tara:strand:+ start:1029 stop:1577 length:549 start_codon:yes stop_codon:yes gene_type:complete
MATLQEEINARIEAERIRRMNMSNPQVNQPGFFSNIFGGPQAIPQTRPQVTQMALNQASQGYNPAMGNQYPAPAPSMFNVFNPNYVRNFNEQDSLQKSLESGIGSIYDVGLPNQGVYRGDGTIPKDPSMLDKMSGLEMMNLIQGLQGLLAQPDADIRLDTSSPGASSGLRLPIQDLYSGLLK